MEVINKETLLYRFYVAFFFVDGVIDFVPIGCMLFCIIREIYVFC